MPPSIARDRFDRVVRAADPVTAIRALVNSEYEDDWFDCKLEPEDKKDPKQRDQKMKQMWLQALSGFANNEGGVLVWGLDARKDPKTNVDIVVGEKPVTDPFGLKSKLQEWRRYATDPPLGNVQVEAYEAPAGSGKGFVVCHIPEGPHKPYRTNEGERSQYYLRSSDNFVVMSPAILRAMFYPRLNTNLWTEVDLVYEFGRDRPSEDKAAFRCSVRIYNSGTATAKDALVVVRVDVPRAENLHYNRRKGWLVTGTLQGKFALQARRPIHPRSVSALCDVDWLVPTTIAPSHLVIPEPSTPKLTFLMYADNMEVQIASVEFRTIEMQAGTVMTVKSNPVPQD